MTDIILQKRVDNMDALDKAIKNMDASSADDFKDTIRKFVKAENEYNNAINKAKSKRDADIADKALLKAYNNAKKEVMSKGSGLKDKETREAITFIETGYINAYRIGESIKKKIGLI